jgi:iron complex outermembrane recepter protein
MSTVMMPTSSAAAERREIHCSRIEDDGFPAQPKANFQLLTQNNQPINCPPGAGNTCASTPWGTVDRTWTNAITTGASLQGINDDKLFGHDNYFTIGGSVDRSKIGFQANSELGYIYPDFFVGPNAADPGTGQIVHTAADIGFSPVSLAAWNTYYSVYFNDTFDITNRLSVTGGGRYNIAQISMSDLLGTSPDLSAQYTFRTVQSGRGIHLQDPAGADDILRRIFRGKVRLLR